MEKAPRTPRTIALAQNQRKPAGEPKTDPHTGAPCPQDQVRGAYKPQSSAGSPSSGAPPKASAG